MANISTSTISAAGGAVSDLFTGFGDLSSADLKAKGLKLQASGQRIQADSTRLNAAGLRIQATGDLSQAGEYDLASSLATANEKFTEQSTAIQEAQQQRNSMLQIGGQRAAVAGAGFSSSGTAYDLLADSAQQGALAKAVLGQQGQITEAGYTEQAQSFGDMAAAARTTAAGEFGIADKTDTIAGQQDQIAGQTDQLASATQAAGETAATGSFISSALKAATAVASVLAAPATGGVSLAIGGAFMGGGSPTGYGSG